VLGWAKEDVSEAGIERSGFGEGDEVPMTGDAVDDESKKARWDQVQLIKQVQARGRKREALPLEPFRDDPRQASRRSS
jgi:hypothetical protein